MRIKTSISEFLCVCVCFVKSSNCFTPFSVKFISVAQLVLRYSGQEGGAKGRRSGACLGGDWGPSVLKVAPLRPSESARACGGLCVPSSSPSVSRRALLGPAAPRRAEAGRGDWRAHQQPWRPRGGSRAAKTGPRGWQRAVEAPGPVGARQREG